MRALVSCIATAVLFVFLEHDIGVADGFVTRIASTWGRTSAKNKFHLSATSSSKTERKPWEFVRFVQQSSKFVTLPSVNPFGTSKVTTATVKPGDVIWQPAAAKTPTTPNDRGTTSGASPLAMFTFAPLDDVVMGGASNSNFDTKTGVWRGTVTDANNGGFIGIRSTPPSLQLDLSKCQGLEWKIQFRNSNNINNSRRGGKKLRFKVIVRDSTEFNGICWTTSVDLDPSPKAVNTIRIPFRKQIPTVFARTVPNQVFRADHVMAVQLTYSKFEYDGDLNPNFELGDIELQISEIRAY